MAEENKTKPESKSVEEKVHYKITVETVVPRSDGSSYDNRRDIYIQVVPNLDLKKVIEAVNADPAK